MPRPLSRWERDWLPPIFAALATLLILIWLFQPKPKRESTAGAFRPPAGGYLFRSWNVENFFDDQDDPKVHDQDEDWFGRRPDLVREKVGRLVEAILLDNDGRGADVLALVEVENFRAVELLRDVLNARLAEPLRYRNIVFRENRSGRHIAPAVLTRLNVRDDLTRDYGIRRILEAHLEAEGVPLVVIVSHWTSRVTDKTELKRSAYADAVYRAFLRNFRDDPTVDVILSGDFNDDSGSPAMIDGLRRPTIPPESARTTNARAFSTSWPAETRADSALITIKVVGRASIISSPPPDSSIPKGGRSTSIPCALPTTLCFVKAGTAVPFVSADRIQLRRAAIPITSPSPSVSNSPPNPPKPPDADETDRILQDAANDLNPKSESRLGPFGRLGW